MHEGRRMMPVVAAGLGLALLVAGIAFAQVYEDRMEPAEIGIRDVDHMVVPPARYVGNAVCAGCHAAAYKKWLGTKHARSFVPMRSMMAMKMGERAGVTACCPAKSGTCLPCHATAHNVPAVYRGEAFRMGEGVACEKCHGPGGAHVEAVEREHHEPSARMKMPGKQDCMACHRPKPSLAMACENCHGHRGQHAKDMAEKKPDMSAHPKMSGKVDCEACHMLNTAHAALKAAEHFDLEAAWKAIAHPGDREK